MTCKLRMVPAAMIAAVLLVQAQPSGADTVYMIGNSFTHNCQPYSVPELAKQQSKKLTIGAHIKSGSPVHNIWGNPDNGREISEKFGKYREALTKHQWDIVTLQPFYKRPYGGLPQSTMQTDIDSILLFIKLTRENPANKKTKFYLYASWPFLWTGKPLQTAWSTATKDELTTATSHQGDYYEHLTTRLRALTDAEIHLVPIPEVMCAFDKKMQAGKVPGISSISEIMGDKLHLDAGLGHYLAGATVYATLCSANPAGLVKPEGHYDGKKEGLFTPETLKVLHETIWQVVSKNAYTGVSTKPKR